MYSKLAAIAVLAFLATSFVQPRFMSASATTEEARVLANLMPVPEPKPTIVYSFADNAPSALWSNATENLSFGGSQDDNRGFVRDVTGFPLEDGHTELKVVETHPQWIPSGSISGKYNVTAVLEATDVFRAKIGFLNGARAGSVKLTVSFKGTQLIEVTKKYDGTLRDLEIDLSPYAGQSGTFLLEAFCNPEATQDWICWIDPRIERLPMTAFASDKGNSPIIVSDVGDRAAPYEAFKGGASLNVHGTFVDFAFTTTEPLVPLVQVSTKAPDPGLVFKSKPADSFAVPFLDGKKTDHEVRVKDLEPNTLYFYIVTAQTKEYGEKKLKGSFTTLRRHVQVKFQSIYCYDDSDDLSKGDVLLRFAINGDPKPNGKILEIDYGKNGLGTKEEKPVNIEATIDDPPDQLVLKVRGWDDDSGCGLNFISALAGLCGHYTLAGHDFFDPTEGTDTGDDGDYQWASAEAKYNISASGPPEAFTREFQLDTGKEVLNFVVSGRFEVFYK